MREGVAAIKEAVDINVAASLGILTQEQVDELVAMGVHRYNHNLETAALVLPQRRHHAHLGGALGDAARVRDSGMEVCCGGIVGHGRDASSSAPSSPPSWPRSSRTRCR